MFTEGCEVLIRSVMKFDIDGNILSNVRLRVGGRVIEDTMEFAGIGQKCTGVWRCFR